MSELSRSEGGVERGTAKISVRSLTKKFESDGDSVLAFEGISFDVQPGEFVGIVGPSGCGKTTLLHVLAGLTMATSGAVQIEGRDVAPLDRRYQMAYMFQHDILLPWKRIIDNVALGLVIAGSNRKEARARARSVLELYGLDQFAELYPSQLSGGMRQRVAVMRTLLVDREIMLLDEPFGALDAITRSVMQDWLLSIWESTKKTIVFITHDTEEAILLCDRVLVMTPRPGRVECELPIQLERPRLHEVVTSSQFGEYRKELLHHIRGTAQ